MLNVRIDTIGIAGTENVQLRFDLADAELQAVARSVETVARERYQNVALDALTVLDLRELTAVHDVALERARDGYAGGTLVIWLPRLGVLIAALAEWCERRLSAGFLRHEEHVDLPLVEALIPELRELHARGLRASLAETALA